MSGAGETTPRVADAVRTLTAVPIRNVLENFVFLQGASQMECRALPILSVGRVRFASSPMFLVVGVCDVKVVGAV